MKISVERPHRLSAAHAAPRCGAKTKSRQGEPCRNPRVRGRPRCRVHGCGAGFGPKKGNRNAVSHGFYTAQAREHRQEILQVLKNWSNKLSNQVTEVDTLSNLMETGGTNR